MFEKSPNIKFHENPSCGSRVVPRRLTNMTKPIGAFCNFANAPKEASKFVTVSQVYAAQGLIYEGRVRKSYNS